MFIDVLAGSLLPFVTQCYTCHFVIFWYGFFGYGLIYWLTVVTQQLVRVRDPVVVGAVQEKGDVCPSKPEVSLSNKN